MIDPSGEIPEGYQLVTVNMQDGRTYAGNIASEDDKQVTLRMIGQNVTLAKSDILSPNAAGVHDAGGLTGGFGRQAGARFDRLPADRAPD